MQITGVAFPLQVIVEVVLSASAFADIPDVTIGLQLADHGKPCFAGGATLDLLLEPAILHAGDHCVREHARA